MKFYIQNLYTVLYSQLLNMSPPDALMSVQSNSSNSYFCKDVKDDAVMLYTGNQMKLRKPLFLTVRVSIVTGERLQN